MKNDVKCVGSQKLLTLQSPLLPVSLTLFLDTLLQNNSLLNPEELVLSSAQSILYDSNVVLCFAFRAFFCLVLNDGKGKLLDRRNFVLTTFFIVSVFGSLNFLERIASAPSPKMLFR